MTLARSRDRSYLVRMRLSSRYNPAGGIADFWNEIRRPAPYRLPVLVASLLCTGGILYWVVSESVLVPPERPKVSFISTLAAGRSDAQIVASNIANQQRKERREAEQDQRDELVKDAYRALGRASGMDVDAMERRAAQERAGEKARVEALLQKSAKPAATLAPAAQ